MKYRLLVVGLGIGLFCGRSLSAQAPKDELSRLSTLEANLEVAMMRAAVVLTTENSQGVQGGNAPKAADALNDYIAAASKDPEKVRALVGRSLWQYRFAKAEGQGVGQAAEEANLRLTLLTVYQNQRIIALLEQQARTGGR